MSIRTISQTLQPMSVPLRAGDIYVDGDGKTRIIGEDGSSHIFNRILPKTFIVPTRYPFDRWKGMGVLLNLDMSHLRTQLIGHYSSDGIIPFTYDGKEYRLRYDRCNEYFMIGLLTCDIVAIDVDDTTCTVINVHKRNPENVHLVKHLYMDYLRDIAGSLSYDPSDMLDQIAEMKDDDWVSMDVEGKEDVCRYIDKLRSDIIRDVMLCDIVDAPSTAKVKEVIIPLDFYR